MEKGFFHPSLGYWQTTGEPAQDILASYPEGTVEVPLKPGPGYEWSGTEWVPPSPETQLAAMIAHASAVAQAHVDETARQRRYSDGVHCASYAVSEHPKYGAEGKAFAAWRDNVWDVLENLEAGVLAGTMQPPEDEAALLALLPVMVWP